MASAALVGIAALTVDAERDVRISELDAAPRGRCASVLKPLLVWAAADGLVEGWRSFGEPAITVSDNAATAALWSLAGGDALLGWLAERTGAAWHVDGDDGEHPSLRVMATAAELARAYGALAADASDGAAQVRRWLRAVRADQTFGLRAVAADVLGVDERSVGVKCGWFGGERVHAVVMAEQQDRTLGGVVMTHRSPSTAERAAAHAASGDDVRLVALHGELAGSTIRDGIRRALVVAAAL